MSNSSRVIVTLAFGLSCFTPLFALGASDATNCAFSGGNWNPSTQKCEGVTATLPGSVTGVQYTPSGGGVNVSVVKRYSDGIISLVNTVFVPVLFAVAFLVFLFGVFKYFILGATEEKSREEGRQFVLWGIIGFVTILSVWGLVSIVANTFGLTAGGSPPSYPTL